MDVLERLAGDVRFVEGASNRGLCRSDSVSAEITMIRCSERDAYSALSLMHREQWILTNVLTIARLGESCVYSYENWAMADVR